MSTDEDETKSGGTVVEIPDEAVQEALDSLDRNKRDHDHGEETIVEVETNASQPEEAPAGEREGPSREELLETVAKLREEAKAARERMLRIAADADNTRKRALKERNETIKYGQEELLRDVLVPLDNLERTLGHIPESDDPKVRSFQEGLTMVWRQFQDALAKHHATGFSSLGERFDPARHEALTRTETADAEPGTILEEMQRGYLLHDRLLRPALVNVACAPTKATQVEGDDGPCAQIPPPPADPESEDGSTTKRASGEEEG